jgi:hypothetical protein
VKLHHSFPIGHFSFAMLLLWLLVAYRWGVFPTLGRLVAHQPRCAFPADVLGGMLNLLVVQAVRFTLSMLATLAVKRGEGRFRS